jgi:dipeptidyl aminopeptidase/acylaminoacyl peptidase
MTLSPSPARSPNRAPFGSWKSPVTTQLIVGETIRLGQPAIGPGGIFWTEGRPQEKGRTVLVRHDAHGRIEDVTPAPYNVRTLAHEYGGGAFSCSVSADGVDEIFFSHFDDQRIYRVRGSEAPVALTGAAEVRYADALVDTTHRRLIAVMEDHSAAAHEPVNSLVNIDLTSGVAHTLASGHDFFSSPALSPDARQLAWLTWDHPDMPWDGTELWLADIAQDGSAGTPRKIAGGRGESLFQPAWSPAGELHFISDRSGWWNLYRLRNGAIDALRPMDAEFAKPQWLFGMRTYGFDAAGRIVCLYELEGDTHLAVLDADAGRFDEVGTPFRAMRDLHVHGDQAVFIGSSPTADEAIVAFDLTTRTHRVLRSASRAQADPAYISIAEAIRYPTEGGEFAHALFYAPVNADFSGPEGALPPLLVISHGGPTSSTNAAFKWSIQYWTSRGFAVVDVNYGGSSGYGRAYRQRLNGQWGVVDVDDSIHAARHLIERGLVNPDQVAIRGGSAGGYTTLCALTFRDFFKAGASHYGIGDLEALVRDTHKFESRYLFRLIGDYPAEQALYHARSPVNFTDRLSSAMILFQGAEDKAVPPNQAEAMYQAVRAKGLPVAYLLFPNEQHGFRRAENISRSFEAELYFYGKIFGYESADAIEPVAIDNL